MTAPSDWLEGLVKAYVGDSISEDFYREVGPRSTRRPLRWCSRCAASWGRPPSS